MNIRYSAISRPSLCNRTSVSFYRNRYTSTNKSGTPIQESGTRCNCPFITYYCPPRLLTKYCSPDATMGHRHKSSGTKRPTVPLQSKSSYHSVIVRRQRRQDTDLGQPVGDSFFGVSDITLVEGSSIHRLLLHSSRLQTNQPTSHHHDDTSDFSSKASSSGCCIGIILLHSSHVSKSHQVFVHAIGTTTCTTTTPPTTTEITTSGSQASTTKAAKASSTTTKVIVSFLGTTPQAHRKG